MNSSEDNSTGERPAGETANSEIPLSKIPLEEAEFLAGMKPRIVRTTLVLGVAGSVLLWLWRGWGWAGGFAVGAALSALNFHWMHAAIGAVADMAVSPATAAGVPGTHLDAGPNADPSANRSPDPTAERAPGPEPEPPRVGSAGAVRRFMWRYALIALAGYVIFRSSVLSLPAFFAGLFVAIVAVLAEIAYQLGRGSRSPGIYG